MKNKMLLITSLLFVQYNYGMQQQPPSYSRQVHDKIANALGIKDENISHLNVENLRRKYKEYMQLSNVQEKNFWHSSIGFFINCCFLSLIFSQKNVPNITLSKILGCGSLVGFFYKAVDSFIRKTRTNAKIEKIYDLMAKKSNQKA